MGFRHVTWTDEDGRKWRTRLPDEAPDDDAPSGIPAGPMPLDGLGLPEHIEIALHNQLFHRGLFDYRAVKKNRAGVVAAIEAALKLSAERVIGLYRETEENSGRTRPADREPESALHPGRRRRTRGNGNL